MSLYINTWFVLVYVLIGTSILFLIFYASYNAVWDFLFKQVWVFSMRVPYSGKYYFNWYAWCAFWREATGISPPTPPSIHQFTITLFILPRLLYFLPNLDMQFIIIIISLLIIIRLVYKFILVLLLVCNISNRLEERTTLPEVYIYTALLYLNFVPPDDYTVGSHIFLPLYPVLLIPYMYILVCIIISLSHCSNSRGMVCGKGWFNFTSFRCTQGNLWIYWLL